MGQGADSFEPAALSFDEMAETAAGVHLYEKQGMRRTSAKSWGFADGDTPGEPYRRRKGSVFPGRCDRGNQPQDDTPPSPCIWLRVCGRERELVRKWDEIKRLEKAGKTEEQILRERKQSERRRKRLAGILRRKRNTPEQCPGIGYLSV